MLELIGWAQVLNMRFQLDLALLLKSVLTLSATLFILLILKLEWWRNKYSFSVPSSKITFLNILGDFSLRDAVKIGSVRDIFLPRINDQMQKFKGEKLFCYWLFYIPLIVACKAEVVEEMIGNNNFMEKSWAYDFLHPWLKAGILTSYGTKWRSRRKTLTPAFHADVLMGFLQILNDKARILVQKLKNEVHKDSIDIIMPISLCTLDDIWATVFGIDVKAQENNLTHYIETVDKASSISFERIFNVFCWPDFIFYRTGQGKELKQHLKFLHDFTNTMVQKRKKEFIANGDGVQQKKRKAMLDILLQEHICKKTLTEEDVREEVETIAFEGHHTPAMGITWTLYLLGLHQDVQDKVYQELNHIFADNLSRDATDDDIREMKYLDRVIKEVHRLYPPIPIIARHVTEESIICGKKVPKGASCLISPYFLHRDDKVFPDPERFDPDRFLPSECDQRHHYAYIPFAAGPRNCIGQRFALMEEKVVLSTFLRHYKIESLDPRDEIRPNSILVLRPSEKLKMRIAPRKDFYR